MLEKYIQNICLHASYQMGSWESVIFACFYVKDWKDILPLIIPVLQINPEKLTVIENMVAGGRSKCYNM